MDNIPAGANETKCGAKARKRPPAFILAIVVICAFAACAAAIITYMFYASRSGAALTAAEGEAITACCGADPEDFTDITAAAMNREMRIKFPAVAKVYKNGSLYAFISKPVAYNGPVALAVVIDGGRGGGGDFAVENAGENAGEIAGVRIVEHEETPHYVRDMESAWFTGRFTGKPANAYLKLARLKARADDEIVAITGATVTTEGVINGVNAAIGVYIETVAGGAARSVPYKVRFEPGAGDGPVETGRLAVRLYGVVLAEIGLEDIRALPSVKRAMSVHTSAGAEAHSFRGALLSDVLGLAAQELAEFGIGERAQAGETGCGDFFGWIRAEGADGYMSGISMEEVYAENNVFIMYEDNGEPLPKKNGEPGGMRIVVLDDVFGQRFTNYLMEISLESGEIYD